MIFSSVTGIALLGLASGLLVGIMAALLLRRRRTVRRTAVQSTTRFMYSGNLKQTNLLDAIQFLEIGRREGILHIYVGRRKGYITFAGGQIADAFFRNAIGKEAVFQMLELDYGDFYFESKTISQPRVITESMMDIALEWDARRYEGAFGGEPAREEPPPEGTAAPAEQPGAEIASEEAAEPGTEIPEHAVPAAGDTVPSVDAAPAMQSFSETASGEDPESGEAIFEEGDPAAGDTIRREEADETEEAGKAPEEETNSQKATHGRSEKT